MNRKTREKKRNALACASILALATSCFPLSSPPPAIIPSAPPALLGCDAPTPAAHCPAAACTPGSPGAPTLPFGCPGNGTVDAAADDIDNLYGSFSASLKFYTTIRDSNPGLLNTQQRQFISDKPTFEIE